MRRTRQLLQAALWTLLKARGFDEISVQNIADAATVNRATFYDHYTDKFALLEASVGARFYGLLEERKVVYDASDFSGASALIVATCVFLEQLHSNETECRSQSAFEPLIDAAVIAAIRRVLSRGKAAPGRSLRSTRELALASASWAIYGSAKAWLSQSPRSSAEAFAPVILPWVLPMLSSRMSRSSSQ